MRDLLDQEHGVRLDIAAYFAEFEELFWRIGAEGFWKLECLQSYQEPGFASWDAFNRGDWAASLQLLREEGPAFADFYGQIRVAGFSHHRVRVVEEPVSPYVQWELHLLQAKDQYGEGVSVLTRDRALALGATLPLPDLVVLGKEALYEVHSTPEGRLAGATRYTDRAVVDGVRTRVQQLHRGGEPLASYFPRAVADLAAPS
ncbi:DUF6879 family protein [Streptacidiphilus sp. P02-A3a]|uniref:DUF6879 family protein n=1 Tax=Streptacidiphilus sp. P02-A3a TaxID=2704468 RepID=UPI0015F7E6F7|nr:DUF6879 family protein [Streptacidiphilus sp. P02-A3a]QMU67174.1 hypothetical protein GXP74_02065 [Streptacidiphilus sp. P02-A3a]